MQLIKTDLSVKQEYAGNALVGNGRFPQTGRPARRIMDIRYLKFSVKNGDMSVYIKYNGIEDKLCLNQQQKPFPHS
jgi:hypothetical protein